MTWEVLGRTKDVGREHGLGRAQLFVMEPRMLTIPFFCRDVGRTINAAAYTSNTAMTVESCVSYCASNGYQYAGVEYYQECCKSLVLCSATPPCDVETLNSSSELRSASVAPGEKKIH